MPEFRHLERPRTRPEIFGLSTLDTVTCALAGAIILMILMASLTDPEASVSLNALREIRQSGDGNGEVSAAGQDAGAGPVPIENLAVVYFETWAEAGAEAFIAASDCGVTLTARLTSDSHGHFTPEAATQRVGVSVWAEGDATACSAFSVGVEGIAPVGCNVTIVSGAHYQSRRVGDCSALVTFTSNDDSVYRFQGTN